MSDQPALRVIGSETPAPIDEVVKMCEKLLAQAKAGELRTMAVVCAYDDASTYADWTTTRFGNEMMAAVSDLFWRFAYARYDSTKRERPWPLDDPAA